VQPGATRRISQVRSGSSGPELIGAHRASRVATRVSCPYAACGGRKAMRCVVPVNEAAANPTDAPPSRSSRASEAAATQSDSKASSS
jgi:hypothetical protein